MKILPRRDWDILSIVILMLLLIFTIYVFPDSVLRIIGIPFLLFFPGYLSITALFPRKEDIDVIERIALSFGLSIAITPLIGFALNYTPWGIRLDPILLSVSAFNFAVAAIALYRRLSVTDPYIPFDPLKTIEKAWSDFQKERGLDRVLSVVLALSVLSSVIALGYIIAFPRPGETFTEFYILDSDGEMGNYPHNLSVGEEATVILGLANHEQRNVTYTILVWLVEMSLSDETNETQIDALYFFDEVGPITLEHMPVDIEGPWKKQWEQEYSFTIDEIPDESDSWQGKIWFSLYKENYEHEYTKWEDYSNDEEAIEHIIQGIRNERLSLSLNLNVSA
ncbi:MAG TPA: DUF1616 domain-containing protein [Candidatus Methanomethylophilaceae archaeon]|nr:hypothetical protein [Candidatus Methanomethylophilaceae archaeon]HIJ00807.1 DUF1616 domain-containing protein [Candidatus Methanomethylophilaceae archaeon]